MQALRLFVYAVESLNAVIGRVVALSLLALIGLVVWEVALRYVFNSPTTWGNELITYIFACYIMLGGGYTLLHRDHVTMDIVYARFSQRGKATIDVLTAGFVLIYCIVLLRETTIMTMDAWRTGQRAGSDWSPPLFPIYIFFAIGAALTLLQAVAKLIRDFHLMVAGTQLLPDPVLKDEERAAL
jgi:TRAP-type mannitol/chloroaromatic compound transport system permease small subunit